MNIALWVVQVLLALTFGFAGFAKTTRSKEQLAPMMRWVYDFSLPTIRVIGVLEILGAIGLILPWLTGILPWLTPLAAACLALVMVGGTIVHLRRHEYKEIIFNLVLLALAVFVVYGRAFV